MPTSTMPRRFPIESTVFDSAASRTWEHRHRSSWRSLSFENHGSIVAIHRQPDSRGTQHFGKRLRVYRIENDGVDAVAIEQPVRASLTADDRLIFHPDRGGQAINCRGGDHLQISRAIQQKVVSPARGV